MSDALDQASEIFHHALERERGERAAYLDGACAGAPELRAMVARLLAAHDGASAFLVSPLPASAGVAPLPDRAAPRSAADAPAGAGAHRAPSAVTAEGWLIGRTIGGCRIVRRIAAGGMGIVFEAEQISPRRRVAIKVVQPALATPELSSRLVYEAHSLARLRHPCIASVFGAGRERIDGDELAFIVMELIDGRPLNEAADARGWGLPERMAVIERIAEAVQHAHDRGVIHRDLKPSNVLVDAEGIPHVLDFGIARHLDRDEARTLAPTAPGALLGTLRYMSPEQLGDGPSDVGTPSDVYALGVIAYELASGRHPYGDAARSAASLIRSVERADAAPLRRTAPPVDRNLESIVMKAIERDVARRYPSARELALDLGRWRRGEPVEARRAGPLLRAAWFVRRHRGVVAAVAIVIVALAAGVALYANEARQARAAAQREAEAAGIARAVSDFLARMLAIVDPNRGTTVDIREIALRARDDVAATLGENTLEAAAVHMELGTIFYNLRLYDEAQKEYAKARRIRTALRGENDEGTLDSINALGQISMHLGRRDEAEALYREALSGRSALLGPDAPKTLIVRNNLASLLEATGKRDEAEREFRAVLESQRRVLGADAEATLITTLNLGALCGRAKRHDEALALWTSAYEGFLRTRGAQHAMTAIAENGMAQSLRGLGRHEEAETRVRSARDTFVATVGPIQRDTAAAENNWGELLVDMGRHAEAVEHFTTAKSIHEQVAGPDHRTTIAVAGRRAAALLGAGQAEDAERAYAELVDSCVRGLGEEHANTIEARLGRAEALAAMRRTDEARRLADEVRSFCAARAELDTAERRARLDRLLRETDAPGGIE